MSIKVVDMVTLKTSKEIVHAEEEEEQEAEKQPTSKKLMLGTFMKSG